MNPYPLTDHLLRVIADKAGITVEELLKEGIWCRATPFPTGQSVIVGPGIDVTLSDGILERIGVAS